MENALPMAVSTPLAWPMLQQKPRNNKNTDATGRTGQKTLTPDLTDHLDGYIYNLAAAAMTSNKVIQ